MGEHARPTENLLLSGLPGDAYRRVEADLSPVEFTAGGKLAHAIGDIERFYFIVSGLVSIIHTSADDHTTEIAVVGAEGGVGVTLVLARHQLPVEAVIQVPGTAWCLPARRLRQEFARGGALQRNLLAYIQALMAQMTQTIVCNRHHTVSQQLCRWLLLTLDRVPSNDLHMTQDTIANMLGVRRSGITEAAARLQRAGAIEYSRGHIHVPSRVTLKDHACECYGIIKAEYDRLRTDLTRNCSATRD